MRLSFFAAIMTRPQSSGGDGEVATAKPMSFADIARESGSGSPAAPSNGASAGMYAFSVRVFGIRTRIVCARSRDSGVRGLGPRAYA